MSKLLGQAAKQEIQTGILPERRMSEGHLHHAPCPVWNFDALVFLPRLGFVESEREASA